MVTLVLRTGMNQSDLKEHGYYWIGIVLIKRTIQVLVEHENHFLNLLNELHFKL